MHFMMPISITRLGVVFYFSGKMCLHPSLGEFVSPHLFLLSRYCISIHILRTMCNSSLGGKECPFVYMLGFD
jgi:hypothetical protein